MVVALLLLAQRLVALLQLLPLPLLLLPLLLLPLLLLPLLLLPLLLLPLLLPLLLCLLPARLKLLSSLPKLVRVWQLHQQHTGKRCTLQGCTLEPATRDWPHLQV